MADDGWETVHILSDRTSWLDVVSSLADSFPTLSGPDIFSSEPARESDETEEPFSLIGGEVDSASLKNNIGESLKHKK